MLKKGIILYLFVVIGTTLSQGNICPNRNIVCQSYESCITWERGCSLGANCLEPGIFEKMSECVPNPVKSPLLPGKNLCNDDEVFARSVDKRCPKEPCPIRLGYNCYPIKGVPPTCKGVNCPFGTYCIIGESCNDLLCEPKPTCSLSG